MTTLTRANLIDQQTGEVNLWVLKGLARREAMATYGAITPRSLRSALKMYAGMIPTMQDAWREQNGHQLDYSTVTPFGRQRHGVRLSAF